MDGFCTFNVDYHEVVSNRSFIHMVSSPSSFVYLLQLISYQKCKRASFPGLWLWNTLKPRPFESWNANGAKMEDEISRVVAVLVESWFSSSSMIPSQEDYRKDPDDPLYRQLSNFVTLSREHICFFDAISFFIAWDVLFWSWKAWSWEYVTSHWNVQYHKPWKAVDV